jgi:hypothetical protein
VEAETFYTDGPVDCTDYAALEKERRRKSGGERAGPHFSVFSRPN